MTTEIEEALRKLAEGKISVEDLPPEALEYAASSLPDLDQDFFDVYCERFKVRAYVCPFCKNSHDWEVAPYFGSFISLRSFGIQGLHANPEVFAVIQCKNCKYSLMFNIREDLERIAKTTEELNVQLRGMQEDHTGEPTAQEEDSLPGSDRQENGSSAEGD